MRAFALALCLAFVPAWSWAQPSDRPELPSVPLPPVVAQGFDHRPIERLAEAYVARPEGADSPLRATGWAILAKLRQTVPADAKSPCFARSAGGLRLDDPRTFYRIVFRDPASEKPVSFLLQRDTHPHSTKLNWTGRAALCQVTLTYGEDAQISSLYVSSPEANPLLAQIPAFVEKLGLTRFAALEASRPTGLAEGEQPFYALISAVPLPYERAALEVTDSLKLPARPDLAQLAKAGTELADDTRSHEALLCPEIGVLAGELAEALARVRDAHEDGCGTDRDGCWKQLDAELEAAYQRFRAGHPQACQATGLVAQQALLATDRAFRKLAGEPKPETSEATRKYRMAPLTHLSFGLMPAAVVGVSGDDARVELDDGRLAPDPLRGPLSLALLNIHPVGYDADRSAMSAAEQFRLFLGVVIGDHIGVAGGAGVAPFKKVRGLALNAGAALVQIDRLPQGKSFGEELGDAKLRRGWAVAGLVGLSYSFQ